jgi:hypothetical protein
MTRLPGFIDRNGVQFAPPDEFMELLNALP